MQYVAFLFTFLISLASSAQSPITGLGRYHLGITTPDSLDRSVFTELDQAYVKGTIALPCTHIRIVKAAKADVDGIPIDDLVLFFYDNRLFKISCEYGEALQRTFVQQYGKGSPMPKSRFTFCASGTDKPMLIGSEIWQTPAVQALAVHAQGYNASCQSEAADRLIIRDQRVSELSSDCELPNTNPVVAEYEKEVNGR